MENRRDYLKGLLTGVGLVIGILLIVWWISPRGMDVLSLQSSGKEDKSRDKVIDEALDRLEEIEACIGAYYLFESESDIREMTDQMLRTYVASMGDPYSAYFTAEEMDEMMESLTGEYYGIGVQVSLNEHGEIHVVTVFSDSPALEAGMMPGDQIIRVAGQDIAGMDLNQVVSYIKGAEGTTVEIVVKRENVNEPVTIQVERREVKIDTVSYEMLEDGIGYLKLTEFDEVSLEQVTGALEDMINKGMNGLILDLRNNPGGLLTSVVDIADLFLPEANVLYMEDKYGTRMDYDAKEGVLYDGDIVILINENTASAAEVLSGALKDHGTAVLVGETTFGKGIVQTYYDLSDGSGVKLTTAHYFTPGGTDIHGVGITPHYVVDAADNSEASGDVQLERAVEILCE